MIREPRLRSVPIRAVREPPLQRHRRSIRLRGWDYASPATYFVTVCTQDRVCLFGDIRGGEMHLNQMGAVVANTWRWLADQYPQVALDESCIMPNHLHGILVIGGGTGPTMKPIGRLIGAFKTVSTKQINLLRQKTGAIVWQGNFWEHIIRDGDEMDRIAPTFAATPSDGRPTVTGRGGS